MAGIIRREGKEFASTNEVLDFVGARRCRFLYRVRSQKGLKGHGERANDRAAGSVLYTLEYERGAVYPIVTEYPDDPRYKSFGPLFSPDGTEILFSQTFTTSDICILPVGQEEPIKVATGANPHWWYDHNTGDTKIVYRDANGRFEGVPQYGKTFALNIDKNGQPTGDPVLISSWGFGGGISTDGRFLCTAYLLPCILDRQTGRLSAPWGTVMREPDHTNQCCCPSIAPDDSGRFMVLRWPHERFTISDFTGCARTHFSLPEGKEEWQTPEWSTHPDFCTASGMNGEFIYDIFAIRIPDKKYLQITTNGGYVHGHLWVGERE